MTQAMRSDVKHFLCEIKDGIATVRLDRPDRKNPLTFDSYAELRDWFRDLVYADDVDVVIFGSNGGNFSSGGDVHDIIGPLTRMNMKDMLRFTRMTGDLVKAIVNCGKPVIAAVDGICVGAGAIIAMASDLRLATPEAKTAFLFTRVGLFQPSGVRGRAGGGCLGAGAANPVGSKLCPYDDQDDVGAGMVHVDRASDRGRGAGAGDLHANRRFRARL